MAVSMTLANLRTRVLERANMLTSAGASSGFVSTAELNAVINSQAGELHDIRIGAYADELTTSALFTVASGASTCVVDAAVYELQGVDRLEGSTYLPLDRCSLRDIRGAALRGPYTLGERLRYHWAGTTLYFNVSDAGGTYRIWYLPSFVELAADGDALTLPTGWHEYVVAGSAAILLAKEESDPSVQLTLKASTKARIEAMAANRDVSGPERIERRNREYDGAYDGAWIPAT